MPIYYRAKLAADEVLTVLGEERRAKDARFRYIILRPGMLTNDAPTGKIAFGRTDARGSVSRADVADVADKLLGIEGANGWYDLLNGEADVQKAIEEVVSEGITSMEGEDIEVMRQNIV